MWSCCSPADIERDVMKGKIAAYHSGSGQVLSEGNAYHFHINIVQGQITNCTEVEFEVNENGKLKVIYGNGAEPQRVPKIKKERKKQKTTGKVFLTEEEFE